MIKNILFDLDGTLTDPKVGITTCVAYAAEKEGLGKHAPDEFISFIGPPLKKMFMSYFNVGDAEGERLLKFYRERFSTVGLFENNPYEGINDLLDGLKKYNLYVATSKPEIYSLRILEKFDLLKFFKAVYGSSLDGSHVEKGELISHLIKKEKLKSDECVMVGDRKYDIIGAKDNGITSLGVLYGYGSREELEAENPEYIAEDIDELKKILYNL
ncbi:MAG: HAD family hydrolase [Ruminococcaceae bacterium]|nr:HAD family hydrolase [Oscillospiraceae bacterium]